MIDWGWYHDKNTKSLFIHFLLLAGWQDFEWMGKQFKRGQFPTGLHSLCKQTGLTVSQVRTCLNRLKSTNEIAIETTNHYSIITVLKYDTYQNQQNENDKQNSKQDDKPIANQSQTDDKQIATSEELKKVIIKEKDTKTAPPDKPVDVRYSKFIDIFNNLWNQNREGKPGYQAKDFAQLKAMLKKQPEATEEQFAIACQNCLDVEFDAKNFSLCYVCARFAILLNLKKVEQDGINKKHNASRFVGEFEKGATAKYGNL
jgi:hypothetical protein